MTSPHSLIQRARQSGNPVIEDDRVVFFWEGDSAPRLISDVIGWEARPKSFKRLTAGLQPASDKTLWSCSLIVPRDAYVEYTFFDPLTQEHFLDPWNSHTVSNGLGDRNNFFYMPETMSSPFAVRRADVQIGRASCRERV